MNPKITKTVIAGIIATAVMTVVMFMAPMMGLPKMNAAEMLSMTMGFPITVGWMMHFFNWGSFRSFLYIHNNQIFGKN